MTIHKSRQRVYDHRIRLLIWRSQDPGLFPELAIPRSTLAGWLRNPPPEVVTTDWLEGDDPETLLRRRRMQERNRMLMVIVRLLFTLIRVQGGWLDGVRLPSGKAKEKILRAIESAKAVLPLASILSMLHLRPARYHAWKRDESACMLDDRSSCPLTSPTKLTSSEVEAIREMATSPDHRHMSLARLALYAQRKGLVYASKSIWARIVKLNGWRRPRLRLHPRTPKVGIRANSPDEIWHIDTSIIRLLDGTKIYLHGVIDNYSRRILAWRLKDRFEAKVTTCEILREALRGLASGSPPPMVLVDGGGENLNEKVDDLVSRNLIRRVVAQKDIRESNSMIESWWHQLKHGWLFLHELDNATKVRRLTNFYVGEHNGVMPLATHGGLTPDEAYRGTGEDVIEQLDLARAKAREERLEVNRAMTCEECEGREVGEEHAA